MTKQYIMPRLGTSKPNARHTILPFLAEPHERQTESALAQVHLQALFLITLAPRVCRHAPAHAARAPTPAQVAWRA